jgi:hypothetical protein
MSLCRDAESPACKSWYLDAVEASAEISHIFKILRGTSSRVQSLRQAAHEQEKPKQSIPSASSHCALNGGWQVIAHQRMPASDGPVHPVADPGAILLRASSETGIRIK